MFRAGSGGDDDDDDDDVDREESFVDLWAPTKTQCSTSYVL